MALYKKESLELLRQRIDLAEVLSSHIRLQRNGASYKALCPFHEEKTPSFVVQKGDSHYHCFGCGAHGDAIAFLMGHLKLSFTDAIESLAERFQVALEKEEVEEQVKGPNKNALRGALGKASQFYHFILLHTEEGHAALRYLYQRGIDLDFIHLFEVGFAPKQADALQKILHAQGIPEEILEQAGLLSNNSSGKRRDFFTDRITFPIRDVYGHVIGFSARKFKEDTFGGKYINTAETPLFKKSQVLFGLSFCRQRIAKERKAIIVEGQIDALRLIYSGLSFAIAGQGTAFGEGHIKELLQLGVNHVYLALDGDAAGREATVKIGNLFQKKGVEVSVVALPDKMDPDSFLKQNGPELFLKLMQEGRDYLTFLIYHLSRGLDLQSPSKKNELVQIVAAKIREWEQPVMVHESLRKLAQLTGVPESMLSLSETPIFEMRMQKNSPVALAHIDPDRILETDLLRWVFLTEDAYPHLFAIIQKNLNVEHFQDISCRKLFTIYFDAMTRNQPRDLLALGASLEDAEGQTLLSEIIQKKVNLQRAEVGVIETIRKILQREWMEKREAIKRKIQSGVCSDEEVLELAKQFDEIKKKAPEVNI